MSHFHYSFLEIFKTILKKISKELKQTVQSGLEITIRFFSFHFSTKISLYQSFKDFESFEGLFTYLKKYN